jgi:hypothetical protein
MFGKLWSTLALALTVTAVAQVRLPIRIVPDSGNVLTQADLTYDGMIRAPASGTDTFSTTGAMTGRVVGGDTHIIVYGGAGGVDYPHIEEWDITGLTPTTSLGTAPQATLYANWGDDYGATGRRSWNDDTTEQDLIGFGDALPKGLLYNATTGYLYGGYSYNYVTTAKWCQWASTLDNPGTGATTTYGPFRYSYDSTARGDDCTRSQYFLLHPTTGKMIGVGTQKSGNAAIPWGPSMIGSADWPTSATTSGQFMTPIELADNYLNYYYPGPPYTAGYTYDVDGTIVGTVKQMKYPAAWTHAFEVSNAEVNSLRADPSQAGYATWGDEVDGSGQPVWFNGTHKKGVIFPVSLNGSATGTTSNCTGVAHSWYRNASNGMVVLSGITGTFNAATTLTGGTSKATGNVIGYGQDHVFFNSQSGTFQVGETVSTPHGSGTVTDYDNFDDCNHECACVRCATGPSTTLSWPGLAIYDPDDLEDARAGSINDYEPQPTEVINIHTAYVSLVTSTIDKGAGVNGGWLNGNHLYIYSNEADSTKSGNPNSAEILIHRFTIDDSAPPAPVGHFPVELFALAGAVWMTGRLTSGRTTGAH